MVISLSLALAHKHDFSSALKKYLMTIQEQKPFFFVLYVLKYLCRLKVGPGFEIKPLPCRCNLKRMPVDSYGAVT
jgi:hypothetical protein